ncbi:hypothetical protein CRYUN_Cryun08bG0084100 [Craigia yunnanensis]
MLRKWRIMKRNFGHGFDFVDTVASAAAAVVATTATAAIDASTGSSIDHGCSLFLGIFSVAGTGRCCLLYSLKMRIRWSRQSEKLHAQGSSPNDLSNPF